MTILWKTGTLIGVGLGPGDPELITIKGMRALQAADVVFVPVRRQGETSYALTIAGDMIDSDRQQVVTLPFPERAGAAWDDRCRTIVEALAGGATGVFLTEGDPSMFSTFGHVAATLRKLSPEITVEVIPGVSSVTAAAAAAELSLADYGERVAILPAVYCLDTLEETLRDFHTVVLVKVSGVLRETIGILERLDLVKYSTYVRRCGRPDQEIVRDITTLRDDLPRDYFALIIVRRTAA